MILEHSQQIPPLAGPDPRMPAWQRDFLRWWMDGPSNAWIEHDGMHVYVRRATRMIDHRRTETLDIGNVSVDDPGRGRFTRLLDWLEPMHECMYVECVLNARFGAWLIRRGYRLDPRTDQIDDTTPSYYRLRA